MLFLQIGDPLGKGLYPEKNWLFFKVEFFFIPILDLILDAVCI